MNSFLQLCKNFEITGAGSEHTHQLIKSRPNAKDSRIKLLVSPRNRKEFMEAYAADRKSIFTPPITGHLGTGETQSRSKRLADTSHSVDYNILERIPDITQLVVDLDFKKYADSIEEIDDDELETFETSVIDISEYIGQRVMEVILDEVVMEDREPELLESLFLTKPASGQKIANNRRVYSFGAHIAFPKIILSGADRKKIFGKISDALLNDARIMNAFMELGTTLQAVLDAQAAAPNRYWYLYGSGKYCTVENMGLPYMARSRTISVPSGNDGIELVKESISDISGVNLTKELQLAGCDAGVLSLVNPATADVVPITYPVTDKIQLTAYQVSELPELVNCIPEQHAEEYDLWKNVGFYLSSLEPSQFDLFKVFSRRSRNYCGDAELQRWWITANPKVCRTAYYKLRNLARTAQPAQFQKIVTDNIAQRVDASISESLDLGNNGIAAIVALILEDSFTYVPNSEGASGQRQGNWYHFTESVGWRKDADMTQLRGAISRTELPSSVYNVLKDIAGNYQRLGQADHAKSLAAGIKIMISNTRSFSTLEAMLRSELNNHNFAEELNRDSNIIRFSNGIYELAAGEFRDITREDIVTISTGNNYPTALDSPGVDPMKNTHIKSLADFFKSILPDANSREYLLICLAASLSGHNDDGMFAIIQGAGGNGKGMLNSLLSRTLGDYFGTVPSSMFVKEGGKAGDATPHLSAVMNCRIVNTQEISENATLQVDQLKSISGGNKIPVRALYQAAQSIEPPFRMWMELNHNMRIPTAGKSIARRLIVFRLPITFSADAPEDDEFVKPCDDSLRGRLEQAAPYFAWFLLKIYYPKYLNARLTGQNNGLRALQPIEISRTTQRFIESCNPFTKFMNLFYQRSLRQIPLKEFMASSVDQNAMTALLVESETRIRENNGDLKTAELQRRCLNTLVHEHLVSMTSITSKFNIWNSEVNSAATRLSEGTIEEYIKQEAYKVLPGKYVLGIYEPPVNTDTVTGILDRYTQIA